MKLLQLVFEQAVLLLKVLHLESLLGQKRVFGWRLLDAFVVRDYWEPSLLFLVRQLVCETLLIRVESLSVFLCAIDDDIWVELVVAGSWTAHYVHELDAGSLAHVVPGPVRYVYCMHWASY